MAGKPKSSDSSPDPRSAGTDSDLRYAQLQRIHELAELGGGKKRVDKQRQDGKQTARERIAHLLDPGTFVEIDKFVLNSKVLDPCRDQNSADPAASPEQPELYYGDGVICGHGTIGGRPVFIFSQDFTVFGGSLSEAFARKITKIMDLALQSGCPLIGLNDSGGARIQEGVQSLAGYAEIFYRNVSASGVIPQISAILGPCAGGAVYSPAITDFCFMVERTSFMFITGPDVIRAVTKESVSKEDLGGALTHNHTSGVAHFLAQSEEQCFAQIRRLLSFLPQSNRSAPPRTESADPAGRRSPELNSVIPENPNQPYDIRAIISAVADGLDFFEVQPLFAANIVIGFVRLGGHSVGIVANQPQVLAGCLDIDASTKAARFVRFCDCFNIPLVTFVDVPGFLPGTKQEFGGIIRHGAKLLYAFAEATVPKLTVIARKAYGGAYDVMSSKHIRSDFNFAYPSAEVAVMGPEGAVNVIYKAELAAAEDPAGKQKDLVEQYRSRFANPWTVAGLGYVDAVIEPADTRINLIRALDLLVSKQQSRPKRKHGNIPL